MTTIQTPEKTSVTPDVSLETLVLCAALFGPEQGSHLLRRALTASILASRDGVDPRAAIELAMYGSDWGVRDAGQECDRLIREAERAILAAEQDGTAA